MRPPSVISLAQDLMCVAAVGVHHPHSMAVIARSATYAICVPSGEKVGAYTASGASPRSMVGGPPPTSTLYKTWEAANTTGEPSGEFVAPVDPARPFDHRRLRTVGVQDEQAQRLPTPVRYPVAPDLPHD